MSWALPVSNHETVTSYIVNITSLRTFDDHLIDPTEGTNTTDPTIVTSHSINVSVPSSQNTTVVTDLSPFTMYEVTVIAANGHGTSLPSYAVRTLTLTPGSETPPMTIGQTPELPDTKKCCIEKGITHTNCVDKLCNPLLADTAAVTDLMICAPWATDTFSCLANGIDHTPCCKARGLPNVCQELCTGNVSYIDFNFFR